MEIPTPRGLAYAQYSHETKLLGSLIRVLPGLYRVRPENLVEVVQGPERFFVFFPVAAATAMGIVKVVVHEPVPARTRPFPLMRMSGAIDNHGNVLDWWLFDGNREWRIGNLTASQKRLSKAEIWNDTLLIDRIVNGWSPERDFDALPGPEAAATQPVPNVGQSSPDRIALQQLEAAGSHLESMHDLRHYFYFPARRQRKRPPKN